MGHQINHYTTKVTTEKNLKAWISRITDSDMTTAGMTTMLSCIMGFLMKDGKRYRSGMRKGMPISKLILFTSVLPSTLVVPAVEASYILDISEARNARFATQIFARNPRLRKSSGMTGRLRNVPRSIDRNSGWPRLSIIVNH